MNITLRRQARWRIEVDGHDGAVETEDLTPLNMTVLGGIIAQHVHESGDDDDLQIAITMSGSVDHEALEHVRRYIDGVHKHALRVKRMAGASNAFEEVPR